MQCQINVFSVFFLKVTMLVDCRMSNGTSFHVRGPATEIVRLPILVHVRGISNVRLPADRRLERPGIADVSVTELLM